MRKHGRAAVRRKIRGDYARLGKYRPVADLWDLSVGTIYRLITKDFYWPSDDRVKTQLEQSAKKRGIIVGVRPLPDYDEKGAEDE